MAVAVESDRCAVDECEKVTTGEYHDRARHRKGGLRGETNTDSYDSRFYRTSAISSKPPALLYSIASVLKDSQLLLLQPHGRPRRRRNSPSSTIRLPSLINSAILPYLHPTHGLRHCRSQRRSHSLRRPTRQPTHTMMTSRERQHCQNKEGPHTRGGRVGSASFWCCILTSISYVVVLCVFVC